MAGFLLTGPIGIAVDGQVALVDCQDVAHTELAGQPGKAFAKSIGVHSNFDSSGFADNLGGRTLEQLAGSPP